jgi:hypothetical protein
LPLYFSYSKQIKKGCSMNSQPESVRGKVDVGLLDKADRLFRNDNESLWVEILQNARRAGASLVSVVIQESTNEQGSCIVTVHDDGKGIQDLQGLLTLGSSGWDELTQIKEDPAGMGFFALCRSSQVEVESGNKSVILTPAVFLGKSEARVEQRAATVPGTRLRFSRASSAEEMKAALGRTAEFYPVEVRLNDEVIERHDFLDGALYRETVDGIEVGFAIGFTHGLTGFHSANWNFYGARLEHQKLEIKGLLRPGHNEPETIFARFNVLATGRIKLQLPDRKGIIEDEFLQEFWRKARAVAYRFFQTEERHLLAFANWREAQELGVTLPEAACLLTTWHACPPADYSDPFFGVGEQRLLPDAANVTLVARDLAHAHTLEAAVECGAGAALEGDLYLEDIELKGYSWYDNRPAIVDTAVFVDGVEYEAWKPDGGRPEKIEVEVSIAQTDMPERRVRVNALIHVDFEASIWDGPCFVAVKNSPWDNASLTGPFCVVGFIVSATFCPSDDSGSDSWDTQYDEHVEQIQREVSQYFRGPKATLLAILRDAIDYEASRIAETLGVHEIRFTRFSGSPAWSVQLGFADTTAAGTSENKSSES